MLLSPFLHSFADELEKIAFVGAAIGALAGSRLPLGNRGKAIGALAGAALGHGTGMAAKKSKQVFWDQQQHREHEQLYGHTPSFSAADQIGSNF